MKFYYVLRNRKEPNGPIEKEQLKKLYSREEANRWNKIFKKCGDPGKLEFATSYYLGLLINGMMLAVSFYIGSTMFYQHWICPEMTNMEVFKNIPNSFFMDWINCESL